jgi:hypothetical protein
MYTATKTEEERLGELSAGLGALDGCMLRGKGAANRRPVPCLRFPWRCSSPPRDALRISSLVHRDASMRDLLPSPLRLAIHTP